MRKLGIIALAALASAAGGQEPPTVRPVQPPPVMVVPAPPPIQVMPPPVDARMRRDFVTWCKSDLPSVEIDKAPIERAVLVRERADPLAVAMCSDTFQFVELVEIDTLSSALVFMAYKPFAPFWPEAEARWGPDLGKLRVELRREALSLDGSGYDRAVRRGTAEAIQVGQGLASLGYFEEARARTVERMDDLIARREDGADDLDFDLVVLAIVRSAIERQAGDQAAAADYLTQFAESVPVEPVYTVNLTINRAAYLAESDRPQEALDLLLPEWESYRAGEGENEDTYQVGGSDREFAWILACAYWRLGDADRSDRYARIVTRAVEMPRDQYMSVTKTSSAIKRRMYRCMDRPDGYFTAVRAAEEGIFSPVWLEFQKLGDTISGGRQRAWVKTRPEAEELASDYRQLPEQFLPALSKWQTAAVLANR